MFSRVFFGVVADVSSSVLVKESQLKAERNLGVWGVELSVWQLYPSNPQPSPLLSDLATMVTNPGS